MASSQAPQHREALIDLDQLLEEPVVAPVRDRVHHLELPADIPGPAAQRILKLTHLAPPRLVLDGASIIDPVYEGKSMAGLIDLVSPGDVASTRRPSQATMRSITRLGNASSR